MADFGVFGASGHTGLHILRQLASSSGGGPLRVVAAGRSGARVRAAVEDAFGGEVAVVAPGEWRGVGVEVAVWEVDAGDGAGLRDMVSRLGKGCVWVGAAGPFRFAGRGLVQAVVESGGAYVDVCGEPEFMEKMELEFGRPAVASGAVVVHACGLDSIPADLGSSLVAKEVGEGGGEGEEGEVVVEMFLGLEAPKGLFVNFATWHAAVESFGSVRNLQEIRKAARALLHRPKLPSAPRRSPFSPPPPHLVPHSPYILPFPGADASVVRRSQYFKASEEEEGSGGGGEVFGFGAYVCLGSWWVFLLTVVCGLVLQLLASSSVTRGLLLAYPSFFSCGVFRKERPPEEASKATKVVATFLGKRRGKGRKGVVVGKFAGMDPGYGMTAALVVEAAKVVAEKRKAGTAPKGVLTPAIALRGNEERILRAAGEWDVQEEREE